MSFSLKLPETPDDPDTYMQEEHKDDVYLNKKALQGKCYNTAEHPPVSLMLVHSK